MKNPYSIIDEYMKENIDFYSRVYDIVRSIPHGKVTTYGIIADFLGAKSSSRLVGWALNAVIDRIDIPCHRVVNRLGELSGKMHFDHPNQMKERLLAEDITFIGEAVDLSKHLWKPQDALDDFLSFPQD
jgi:methylated-DNA-protein-cysteine methyltransferase-like protein